jgi:hypothetical protein
MRLKDLLPIGELGPLPIVGLGLAAVVAPYFIPALRSRAGDVVKASAKLFAEAEFGAEGVLTEWLVDATVDALMSAPVDKPAEQRRQHTDRVLDRFFSRAHAGARRRGFDRDDARGRYHGHLAAIERTLKQKQERAGAEHAPMFAHALHRVATERQAHRKAWNVATGPGGPQEVKSPRPA